MFPSKNKRAPDKRTPVVCRRCGHRLRRAKRQGSFGDCTRCGGPFTRPAQSGDQRKRRFSDNRWSGQVHPCPNCGSGDTRIYFRRLPIRYLKCDACGYNFKATELVIRGEPLRAAKRAGKVIGQSSLVIGQKPSNPGKQKP